MRLDDSVTRCDALAAALMRKATDSGFSGESAIALAFADAAYLAQGAASGSDYCLSMIAALIESGMTLPGVSE